MRIMYRDVIEIVDFPIKNGDFPIKNGDFPINTLDHLWGNWPQPRFFLIGHDPKQSSSRGDPDITWQSSWPGKHQEKWSLNSQKWWFKKQQKAGFTNT